jgi:hypothetical protein
MGFLDKAKAAANDLSAKVDTALAGSGLGGPGGSPGSAGTDAERYLRDLGVLAFLDAQGRPAPEAERARVLGALRELDARGALHALTLHTAAPPPPGGAPTAHTPPPPFGGAAPSSAPPPPPGGGAGAAPTYPAPPPPPGPTAPPPPPSWLT